MHRNEALSGVDLNDAAAVPGRAADPPRRLILVALLVAAVCGVLPAGAAAASYQIHDLGGNGQPGFGWAAVNDSGQVGGAQVFADGSSVAARWDAGKVSDLGTPRANYGASGSAIAADGTVLGQVTQAPPGSDPGSSIARYPAWWSSSGDEHVLYSYPAGESGGFGSASANGTAIHTVVENNGSRTQAISTPPYSSSQLIPGSAFSFDNAVNNSGHAVVNVNPGYRFWDGSTLRAMSVQPGGRRSLNNRDQVAGMTVTSTGSGVAAIEQEPSKGSRLNCWRVWGCGVELSVCDR